MFCDMVHWRCLAPPIWCIDCSAPCQRCINCVLHHPNRALPVLHHPHLPQCLLSTVKKRWLTASLFIPVLSALGKPAISEIMLSMAKAAQRKLETSCLSWKGRGLLGRVMHGILPHITANWHLSFHSFHYQKKNFFPFLKCKEWRDIFALHHLTFLNAACQEMDVGQLEEIFILRSLEVLSQNSQKLWHSSGMFSHSDFYPILAFWTGISL